MGHSIYENPEAIWSEAKPSSFRYVAYALSISAANNGLNKLLTMLANDSKPHNFSDQEISSIMGSLKNLTETTATTIDLVEKFLSVKKGK